MFCIPKHLVDEFMRRIRSGEINAEAMMAMSSQEEILLTVSTSWTKY
jgi:hypothetical protein